MLADESRQTIYRQRVEAGLLVEPALRSEEPRRVPLAERQANWRVPGVSIAVLEDGDLAWAKGYGVTAADGTEPVTTNTLFQAASISKPTTALAVLRLVQQGRLDLDEDVNRYLRSWQVPANGEWQPRLTLRHLLSHTGGVTVHGFPGYRADEPLPTLLQILRGEPPANTAPIRVDTIPGLQFRYSGGGTTIIQQLLVDLLEKPFPELMRELVLEPVGMTDSTFALPLPEPFTRQAATGHRFDGAPLLGKWHVYPEQAAAGLWTTPTDLARLTLAVQRSFAGHEGAFLSSDLVRAMLTRQFGSNLGLGFFLEGNGPNLRFYHGGGNEGFRCLLVAYAEWPLGAVVMTNGDAGGNLNVEILETIGAEYGWPVDPGYEAPPRRQPWPGRVTLDAAVLARYVGVYVLRPDVQIVVARVGESLTLEVTGQKPFAVDPIAETEFRARALNLEIAFQTDDQDSTVRLTLKQNGGTLTARKL
jgi:CubicO group peptidase (beta-lactamase class C family)